MEALIKKTNTPKKEFLKKVKKCVDNTTGKHYTQALVEVATITKMMEKKHM
jgi:hypothetical protein